MYVYYNIIMFFSRYNTVKSENSSDSLFIIPVHKKASGKYPKAFYPDAFKFSGKT